MYTRLSDRLSRYLALEHTTERRRLWHAAWMLQHDHDRSVSRLDGARGYWASLDNTIVVYSTDNGPEHSAPGLHGAHHPVPRRKDDHLRGRRARASCVVRWPGKIPAGTEAQRDPGPPWTSTPPSPPPPANPTMSPAKVLEGDTSSRIDGVNNLDYWMGKAEKSSRTHIFHYYESKLTAVRMGPWKFHFSTKEDYYANVVPRTVPLVFNVRMDPYES